MMKSIALETARSTMSKDSGKGITRFIEESKLLKRLKRLKASAYIPHDEVRVLPQRSPIVIRYFYSIPHALDLSKNACNQESED